ncbi:FecR domain-containing protein [Pseudomonas sp. LRF_L74]|uniref:FecR domain-containing protein n=1 Tax=Pseudomonas sp. LRF_L74 TaxID=3369422 RepID=UPI003F5F9B0D
MNAPALPDAVLDQAIGWLVRLQSGHADAATIEACSQWRKANPLHEQAWQALQQNEADFHALAALPGNVAATTLGRLQDGRHNRRQTLKLLGLGVLASSAGWLTWRQSPGLRADFATATGERRVFTLDDGTRLHLNTASAVNIHFGADLRLIELLQGEVFIDTGADAQSANGRRPFWVQTRDTRLQAIGTAFGVRLEDGRTRLRVEDGIVAIGAGQVRVSAGQEYLIDATGSRQVENDTFNASAWTRGQLVAKRMRMDALVAELSRYRRGWLGCDPAVAGLEVSGVFQLDDIDQALSALSDSLPVRIERFTPLWTQVMTR